MRQLYSERLVVIVGEKQRFRVVTEAAWELHALLIFERKTIIFKSFFFTFLRVLDGCSRWYYLEALLFNDP